MGWTNPDEVAGIVSSQEYKKYTEHGGVEGLAKLVKSDLKIGLKAEDLKSSDRTEFYGKNAIPQAPSATLWELMCEAMEDKTLITLSVAAVFSLVLGLWEDPKAGWIEGAAILIAVAVVVLVTALNDYEKEKQFRKLNSKKENILIKCFRDGKQTQVPVHEINVGDVVVVETGDILCADGIMISGHNLVCDQSSVTGESDTLKKSLEKDPFMLSGCLISEGVGRVLVLAVGVHSMHGKTMMALQGKPEETPLQIKLDGLADQIAGFGMGMSILTTGCLCIKHGVYMYMNNIPVDMHLLTALTKFIITGITILVVAVPEGLPLAVTISLAYSVMKMFKDEILVRRLEACETMGGASAICSDKTGTLTLNKMTITKGVLGGNLFDEVSKALIKDYDNTFFELVKESLSCNTTVYRNTGSDGKSMIVGSKTESALVGFLDVLGFDFESIKEEHEVVEVFPFSSKEKRMVTVTKTESGKRVLVKGASEIVLGLCDKINKSDGQVVEMSEGEIRRHLNEIESFASQALRTIGIAYLDVDDNFEVKGFTDKLTLLGIVGIQDPVRPEVPNAVRSIQRAGVTVRMVTGDNLTTAKAIAKNCGIEEGIHMEGPDFRKLSEDKLREVCPKLRILARSSPTDKLILVNTLKELGEIVAVTGDGANDGPALSQAHVGFSMGITGTEIAKQASAIILLDDNFKSIVQSCIWGRNVFDSIRKFIQFQLTVNVVAVTLAFIGSLTNDEGTSPLKPVQLLWVNLIMDTMAALALATEPPSPDLLDRPPYGPSEPLITKLMIKNILGQAVYQLIINFFFLYKAPSFYGFENLGDEHLTLFFNVFVMCQIFNEINCRKIHGETNVFDNIGANPAFVLVMLFTIVVQYIFVELGGAFAGTVPLSLNLWMQSIAIGALSIPIGFILRLGGEKVENKNKDHKAMWKNAKVKIDAARKFSAGKHHDVSGSVGEKRDSIGKLHEFVHRPHHTHSS